MDGEIPSLISRIMGWVSRLYKKVFSTNATIPDKQNLKISDNPNSVIIINNNYFSMDNVESKVEKK